ncbi:DUF2062 domain-containing protein [Pannonibacter indicus]|uniref:Uncharacterized conserved protein, DUF2062 family n=1 Tax=Pannonibacter indicus TaxID=466044 RepID=A0A0K6HYE8_9HYPH|nr:DUF2062 domain-containing protein [Pannonibacter indicus]CUA96052.1 Uncharacterized conserved protein, DUF2062 family [Pannonibacter indicus]
MLFQRRTPPTRLQKMRVAVWPRASWSRSFRYYGKRVLRLTASPDAVARGFAAGAFASFTPFMGFHFLLAAACAFAIRGNIIASALGTAVGNPLTFPFIWAATYKLGHLILGSSQHEIARREGATRYGFNLMEQSLDTLWPVIKPMLIGGIPLGLVCGALCYVIVFQSVRTYQEAKRLRLEKRRDASRKAE